jgi:hypothetical protein
MKNAKNMPKRMRLNEKMPAGTNRDYLPQKWERPIKAI